MKDLWIVERTMLKDGADYRAANAARRIPDSPASEVVSVAHDEIGHQCLVMLDLFPKWKAYTLSQHPDEVERLANYGSWQAKRWLGLADKAVRPRPPVDEMAERFFFGDLNLLMALCNGYGWKVA